MPKNLKRYYGQGDLHFITFSCHQRKPLLGTAKSRSIFTSTLDEVRSKYQFKLLGYVVMPEHVHLLLGEPRIGDVSKVIQSLKLRFVKRIRAERAFSTGPTQFWQSRFYDFNVWAPAKRREKLEYMHRNPIMRGLVEDPKDWSWSSYSSYWGQGTTLIAIDFVD